MEAVLFVQHEKPSLVRGTNGVTIPFPAIPTAVGAEKLRR
jgi:hypothetical protein